MKILLTGAGGFLGRATAGALIGHGHAVRALLRPAAGAPPSPGAGSELVLGDLRTLDLDAALAGVDAVVHLAAHFQGDAMEQFQGTVVPTERLLDAMVRAGTRRLLLVSSFSVYDWSGRGAALTEASPLERRLERRDGYAIAKTWQERLCRSHAETHDIALTILRPGFIWGRERPWVAGVGLRVGRTLVVNGPLRRLPLTHVESCADCIALAVDCDAARGETFDVVDTDDVRAWRYAEALVRSGAVGARRRIALPYHAGLALALAARALARPLLGPGLRLPGLLVPERYRARFRSYRFPNAKAMRLLGWKPRPHADALARELRP
jgi:UDP-glucose 4-epimerase